MARAYLGLGSNIGDKIGHLREAAERLAQVPGIHLDVASKIYRTPPWGVVDQDWFANAVLRVETTLAPEALLDAALAVEQEMGRLRHLRWGPRLIDIDLLLHEAGPFHSPRLTLPHPAMLARAFVLVPLGEIAPGLMLAGESVETHLARLERAGIEPLDALLPQAATG